MNRNIALINDLACFGKSSISSQSPIISAFGDIPAYAITSYLSNSMSFDTKEKFNVSDNLKKTLDCWDKNNLKFDGVITGYIDNPDDILNIRNFIADRKLDNPRLLTIVDPVFADNGELYCAIKDEHIDHYKKLMEIADVITPNISEACILTGSQYDEYVNKYCIIEYDKKDKEKVNELSKKIVGTIMPLLDKLRIKKNQITIITGIELYNAILTVLDVYDGDHGKRQTTCNYADKMESRIGTGDLFDAMFMETCFCGFAFPDALSITTSFINNALRWTKDQNIDKKMGVVFEPILVSNVVEISKQAKLLAEKRKQQSENK